MASTKGPNRGDLIEVRRGSYAHWAVYVGDGFIIHLVPSNVDSKATVRKEKLSEYLGGEKYRVNNYLDKKTPARSSDVIVNEAERLVGQKQPYSLHGRNCEHFATKLRYGTAVSKQVRDATWSVLLGWPFNKVAGWFYDY